MRGAARRACGAFLLLAAAGCTSWNPSGTAPAELWISEIPAVETTVGGGTLQHHICDRGSPGESPIRVESAGTRDGPLNLYQRGRARWPLPADTLGDVRLWGRYEPTEDRRTVKEIPWRRYTLR